MSGGFYLRLVIPIFINLLKSFSEALPWDWDAFRMFDPKQTSWTKVSFHVLLLLFFSSTSITFILLFRPWPTLALIRFRFGNFSPHLAILHVCSLVFPQALFWYMYPAMLVVNHFLGWFNVNLSALPVWNLHISSTFTSHEETNIQIIETDVPVAEVSIAISPQDTDEGRFFGWLNNKLSALPVWNLHISSTLTHDHDRHRFEADTDIELHAPLPQVGDSDV